MENVINNAGLQSDLSIIERIVEGERSLFELLVRRYNALLYKIARSYGFSHQDAEDLMQDTYVLAYTALAKFEGRASFKTWITRIMISRCLYKLKYGYYKYEAHNHVMPGAVDVLKTKETPTEATVTNRELSIILEKSLCHIPDIYRTVFVLREVEGFSVAETADLLQITPVNVKVRLNRAKTLLQKGIEKFYSRADIYAFNLIYCDAMVQRVFQKINAL